MEIDCPKKKLCVKLGSRPSRPPGESDCSMFMSRQQMSVGEMDCSSKELPQCARRGVPLSPEYNLHVLISRGQQ